MRCIVWQVREEHLGYSNAQDGGWEGGSGDVFNTCHVCHIDFLL